MKKQIVTIFAFAACLTLISMGFLATASYAKRPKRLIGGQCGFEAFLPTCEGRKGVPQRRKGCARHPKHCESRTWGGGEYGEGAMRIEGNGRYYGVAAGWVGFHIGAQKTNLILVFMQDAALKIPVASSGWKAGVEGSAAFIDVGKEKSIDTVTSRTLLLHSSSGRRV